MSDCFNASYFKMLYYCVILLLCIVIFLLKFFLCYNSINISFIYEFVKE